MPWGAAVTVDCEQPHPRAPSYALIAPHNAHTGCSAAAPVATDADAGAFLCFFLAIAPKRSLQLFQFVVGTNVVLESFTPRHACSPCRHSRTNLAAASVCFSVSTGVRTFSRSRPAQQQRFLKGARTYISGEAESPLGDGRGRAVTTLPARSPSSASLTFLKPPLLLRRTAAGVQALRGSTADPNLRIDRLARRGRAEPGRLGHPSQAGLAVLRRC